MIAEKDLKRQTIRAMTFNAEDTLDVYTAADAAREILENSAAIIECAQEAAMHYENTSHLINALSVALEGLENVHELTEYIRHEWYKIDNGQSAESIVAAG